MTDRTQGITYFMREIRRETAQCRKFQLPRFLLYPSQVFQKDERTGTAPPAKCSKIGSVASHSKWNTRRAPTTAASIRSCICECIG